MRHLRSRRRTGRLTWSRYPQVLRLRCENWRKHIPNIWRKNLDASYQMCATQRPLDARLFPTGWLFQRLTSERQLKYSTISRRGNRTPR